MCQPMHSVAKMAHPMRIVVEVDLKPPQMCDVGISGGFGHGEGGVSFAPRQESWK